MLIARFPLEIQLVGTKHALCDPVPHVVSQYSLPRLHKGLQYQSNRHYDNISCGILTGGGVIEVTLFLIFNDGYQYP